MGNPQINRQGGSPPPKTFTVLGSVLAVVSVALALGPDAWMEWILWGTTIVSRPNARIALAAVAALIVLILIWPLVKRR